jgi:hypothetical protein
MVPALKPTATSRQDSQRRAAAELRVIPNEREEK